MTAKVTNRTRGTEPVFDKVPCGRLVNKGLNRHNMLTFLNQQTIKRGAWLALLGCVIAFELTALFFQYAMGLAPCVMCIYQRTAMLGIGVAALVGAIAPHSLLCRWAAYLGWGYSALVGLLLAREHVAMQTNPSPFFSCEFKPNFPSWLRLDEMVPGFFEATGDCSEISWVWMGYSMSQWMVVIFSGFVLALAVVVLNRLRPSNRFLP